MTLARRAHWPEDARRHEANHRLGITVATHTRDEAHTRREVVLKGRYDRRRHGVGDRRYSERRRRLPLAKLAQRRRDTVGIAAGPAELADLRQFRHQHGESRTGEGVRKGLQAWLGAT